MSLFLDIYVRYKIGYLRWVSIICKWMVKIMRILCKVCSNFCNYWDLYCNLIIYVLVIEGFDEVFDCKIWGFYIEKVDYEICIVERCKKMLESINWLEVDLEMRRIEVEWLFDDLEDENGMFF